MISREHARIMAAYNRWMNERLYELCAGLSDSERKRDRGAFFKSVHGTLNHLLLADRIWMRRFTGSGEHPGRLDAILYDDFAALHAARRAEDARISAWVDARTEADLTLTLRYRTFSNPRDIEQPLAPALDHFFNHQTHHRGQAHCLLSGVIGNEATPSLDLIVFQRATGFGGLRST
jgi:uncharacterized damage-inducible protein DinB